MPEDTIPGSDPNQTPQATVTPLEGAAPPTAPEAPASGTPDSLGTLPAPDQYQSIRDAAGSFDYDLSSYESDEDAFRHLVDRARDYERLEQTNQHYESLLTAQQAAQQSTQPAVPAQPVVPQQETWEWQPPPYNPTWQSQVERNPDTGAIQPINGGTLGTVNQLQNFYDYRANHMERFWVEGPHKYMAPYLERREKTSQEAIYGKVQEMIDSSLGNQSAQTAADKFLAENQWVYERDANDQIMRSTITGQPELSPDGKIFQKFMVHAEQRGYPQPEQQGYAMDMLEAHRIKTGQAGAVPTSDVKKTQFLQDAAGFTPSAAGSETNRTPDVDGVPPAQNPNLQLEDLLRQNFQAEGITDKDLAEVY